MNLPTHWLSAVLLVIAAASVIIAVRTRRLAPFPGQRSFVLLQVAVVWWTAVVALQHGSDQPETKVFWAELAWLGIFATPGCWGLFTWNYIHGRYRPAPRILYPGLLALSVLVWGIALTNDYHHLFYTATMPVGVPPSMSVKFFHGPLYFLIAIIGYSAMIFVLLTIVSAIINSRHFYRQHYVWFAVASCIPWLFNIAYLVKVPQFITFDLTPFSFIAMNGIFYWLISRRQLFDLLPIAHSMLLDAIPDPVLVLDSEQRIAECNPAAIRLMGNQKLVGQSLHAIPALHRGLGASGEQTAGHSEVAIGLPPHYFDVGQVPLTYAGRGVGRLVLLRDISHRKEAEDRLQSALAELETQLQSNLALQQKLREESIRDPLTGLHNRRFLDELGPILLAEAKRTGSPLGAAMLDIDHFKRLNDTHGHGAGDAVLRGTGVFLRQQVRQSDAVFRLGGEEFLVLLPHTPDLQALAWVEALRGGFASLAFAHEGKELKATVSAGLAMFPADALDLPELLRMADSALYRAKGDGRNRVVRWQRDLTGAPRAAPGMG